MSFCKNSNLHYFDLPEYHTYEQYQDSVDKVVDYLSSDPGIVSIYQVGSISDPGISDLDLVVFFDDGYKFLQDPLYCLSKKERYFFIHNLFGTSIRFVSDYEKYAQFLNYKLLYGQPIHLRFSRLDDRENSILRKQIALEYLLKMYINLTVELTYRVVKIRGLLLHGKAISYDLQFLNIQDGVLFDLAQELLCMRKTWFSYENSVIDLLSWLQSFYQHLNGFLTDIFKMYFLYAPKQSYSLAHHISLLSEKMLSKKHRGIVLPGSIVRISRRSFNLHHRLNRFLFYAPIDSHHIPYIINQRYRLSSSVHRYNRVHLPYIIPGLNILPLF